MKPIAVGALCAAVPATVILVGLFLGAAASTAKIEATKLAPTTETPAPTADDMVNLLYPECRNTPIAQMTRKQIADCDVRERFTRGMLKLIDEAHERNDQDAAAMQRAKDRETENLKKGRGPGSFEVCGPDRWVKDHWEPSCH